MPGIALPLPAEQSPTVETQLLKTKSTEISPLEANSKKVGSKARDIVGPIQQVHVWHNLPIRLNGRTAAPLRNSFSDSIRVKGAAPEGTPDRQADVRAGIKLDSETQPLALSMPPNNPSNSNANASSQIEMNAATLFVLRSMMTEDIILGMGEVEARFASRVDDSLQHFCSQLADEHGARKKLEDRVHQLEMKLPAFSSFLFLRCGKSRQVDCRGPVFVCKTSRKSTARLV